jgi:hypothetical protein
MRERNIESHLRKEVKALGGLCWKVTSPNLRGVPDRIVLMADGWACWVELKAPGKLPNVQQQRRHNDLWALGHRVAVLDSIEKVDLFLERFK